jgi:hypothetical protein
MVPKRTQPQQLRLQLCPAPKVPGPGRPEPPVTDLPPSQILHALAELLRESLHHQSAPTSAPGGRDDASQAPYNTP